MMRGRLKKDFVQTGVSWFGDAASAPAQNASLGESQPIRTSSNLRWYFTFMANLRDIVSKYDCTSWEELLMHFGNISSANAVKGSGQWIYRGQASAAWLLKPSIEIFQES